MKFVRVLFSMLCLLVLAACNLTAPSAATSTPPGATPATQIPFPTLPAASEAAPSAAPATLTPPPVQTSTPIPSQAPTKAPTASPTAKPPTPAPTKAPTQAPTKAPTKAPSATASSGFPQVPEAILILSPGPDSVIVSPVKISGQADPTFEQNLVAKVTGENGLAIASKATTIQAEAGKRGPFSVSISFKVAKDQPGRVAVWDTSAKDGGLVHFTSQNVQLKMNGTASITAEKEQSEPLVITKPAPNTQISGGKLVLQGWSAPVFENTINVILCGEGGTGKKDPFCGTTDNILAKTTAVVNAPDAGQPGTFSLTINYKVKQPVNARVAVYFTSPRDGGLLHLTSEPLLLKP